jgi:lipoprotein signal peptidase
MGLSTRGLRGVYALTAFVGLVADQITKLWVVASIAPQQKVPVIPDLFYLAHIQNTGGAFGLFGGLPDVVRRLLFILLPAIILVALVIFSLRRPARPVVIFSLRRPARPVLVQTSLALVLGGALGNFVDRLRLDYVVDFLLFHWRDTALRWPAFNVADMGISVGVALLILCSFREGKEEGKGKKRGGKGEGRSRRK